MNKKLALFLLIGVILGMVLTLLFNPNEEKKEVVKEQLQDRYEFVTIVSDYFIIFDKQTGQYWQKVGANDWEKQESIPVKK